MTNYETDCPYCVKINTVCKTRSGTNFHLIENSIVYKKIDQQVRLKCINHDTESIAIEINQSTQLTAV